MGSSVTYGGDFDSNESSSIIKYTRDTRDELDLITDAEIGDIARVRNTTGTGLLNLFSQKKLEGAYEFASNGWEYGNQDLQDEISSNIANIQSNDQDILSLQNNKYDANNPLGFEIPSQLDQRDQDNKNRSNHTGTQALSTVDGLVGALNSKLDLGGYVGTAQDIVNDIRRRTWNISIYSSLPLMNNTNAFEPFFIRETLPNTSPEGVHSFIAPYTGTIRGKLYVRHSMNTTGSNFLGHILINGDFKIPIHVESKDSSGIGINVPVVQNSQVTLDSSVNSSTDQFINSYGEWEFQVNQGEDITSKFEYRCQFTGTRAVVYECLMGYEYIFKNES